MAAVFLFAALFLTYQAITGGIPGYGRVNPLWGHLIAIGLLNVCGIYLAVSSERSRWLGQVIYLSDLPRGEYLVVERYGDIRILEETKGERRSKFCVRIESGGPTIPEGVFRWFPNPFPDF